MSKFCKQGERMLVVILAPVFRGLLLDLRLKGLKG